MSVEVANRVLETELLYPSGLWEIGWALAPRRSHLNSLWKQGLKCPALLLCCPLRSSRIDHWPEDLGTKCELVQMFRLQLDSAVSTPWEKPLSLGVDFLEFDCNFLIKTLHSLDLVSWKVQDQKVQGVYSFGYNWRARFSPLNSPSYLLLRNNCYLYGQFLSLIDNPSHWQSIRKENPLSSNKTRWFLFYIFGIPFREWFYEN